MVVIKRSFYFIFILFHQTSFLTLIFCFRYLLTYSEHYRLAKIPTSIQKRTIRRWRRVGHICSSFTSFSCVSSKVRISNRPSVNGWSIRNSFCNYWSCSTPRIREKGIFSRRCYIAYMASFLDLGLLLGSKSTIYSLGKL